MTKGKIKNLRNYPVLIRWLGWIMPANSENIIGDDFDYRAIEAAEDELVSLSTALDIEIENGNATPQVMTPAGIRDWIKSSWRDERAIPPAMYRIEAIFDSPVPSTGFLFLSHTMGMPHSEVGFITTVPTLLTQIFVTLDQAEAANTYDIRVYANPTDASPTLIVGGKLSITSGSSRLFQVVDLVDIELAVGEYGIVIERTAGSGQSTFVNGTAILVLEEQ